MTQYHFCRMCYLQKPDGGGNIALAQKEKKKDIWGYSNGNHFQCTEQSKGNISEDVQL